MIIRFLLVLACFIVVVITCRYAADKRDWRFLFVGMACTLLAEIFWLYDITLAVAVYCFVPVSYMLRAAKKGYAILFIIQNIWLFPFGFLVRGNVMSAFAILYIGLYIAAVIVTVRNLKLNVTTVPFSNRAMALTGLLIYFVCDVCMVLSYTAPIRGAFLFEYATWALFPLAQVMFALSALKVVRSKKLEKIK